MALWHFFWTSLAMLAFAANSVLNRMAVGAGLIDPVSYAVIRLAAGAVVLALLVLARRVLRGGAVWPGCAGGWRVWAGLLAYLFCFSMAYLTLDAGIGALILFGSVQITMFAGALMARETVPALRWAGAGLAFAGLVGVGGAGRQLSGHLGPVLAMAGAGVGWGIYSLAGRGAVDPLAGDGGEFCAGIAGGDWRWLWSLGLAVLVQPLGIWLAVVSGAVTSGLGYALWYAVGAEAGGGAGGGGATDRAIDCGRGRRGLAGRRREFALCHRRRVGSGRRGFGEFREGAKMRRYTTAGPCEFAHGFSGRFVWVRPRISSVKPILDQNRWPLAFSSSTAIRMRGAWRAFAAAKI